MSEAQTLAAANLTGRYTELPKMDELLGLGVRPEITPTFYALADYASNQTGDCWPMMQTIAAKLGKSVRTVQRHLHELQDFGLVEFTERLRDGAGRYRGYVYKLMHTAIIGERRKRKREEAQERERQHNLERSRNRRKRLFSKKSSTGHESPVQEDRGTSRSNDYPPNPPTTDFKEGYEWFFGDPTPPQNPQQQKKKPPQDFREGYEWFFD